MTNRLKRLVTMSMALNHKQVCGAEGCILLVRPCQSNMKL